MSYRGDSAPPDRKVEDRPVFYRRTNCGRVLTCGRFSSLPSHDGRERYGTRCEEKSYPAWLLPIRGESMPCVHNSC